MNRRQRYTHEVFVRVRDFGAAHSELFPASSPGGARFAQVALAVSAVDEHLKNRVLGKAGARGVSTSTRAAVVSHMKTLAKAARRITRKDGNTRPFRFPPQRSLDVVHDLDVIVEVATSRDPVLAASWRVARRIEAIYRSSSAGSRTASDVAVESSSTAAPVRVLDRRRDAVQQGGGTHGRPAPGYTFRPFGPFPLTDPE